MYKSITSGKETPAAEMPSGHIHNAYKLMRKCLKQNVYTKEGSKLCRENARLLIVEIRKRNTESRRNK